MSLLSNEKWRNKSAVLKKHIYTKLRRFNIIIFFKFGLMLEYDNINISSEQNLGVTDLIFCAWIGFFPYLGLFQGQQTKIYVWKIFVFRLLCSSLYLCTFSKKDAIKYFCYLLFKFHFILKISSINVTI
jgi:hypothetical protein